MGHRLYFKTSYVEVYLGLWEGDEFGGFISKHLMLKFILRQPVQVSRSAKISKHLMLKFINTKTEKLLLHLHFKTSYVEVYPGQWMDWGRKEKIISKHLMLKFIPHFLVTFISFYLFSPSFFLISIIFTKHQPIFFFLSNISQIPRLYNTFSTFFFFSPGKYFYNSQSGMGCSSDVFTTENAWS